jgi:hypothetical protein
MGMKTILVLMEKYDVMQSVLETALLLARRCGSYIEGVPLRWAIQDFALGDVVVAFPTEQYEREIAADAQRARQTFETFVGNYGRAFDVIVMNRPDENSSVLYRRALDNATDAPILQRSFSPADHYT